MPMHALNLHSDQPTRFAAVLSFGIASPMPSQHCAPPAEQAAIYDLLPADEAPALELAATETAWGRPSASGSDPRSASRRQPPPWVMMAP